MPPLNCSDTVPRIDLGRLRAKLAGQTARQYWRSLEELAETPEFRNYLEREFPSQLSVWEDSVGRRSFLRLMAASLALAGVTGCTRSPQETIVPYVQAPEDFVPGKPLYYATAMPRPGDALGLLVESHLGRPTKVEGNPLHPASLGATDAIAQASILTMYDPDRSQTILHRGVIETWERFTTAITAALEHRRAARGVGLRILTGTITSPTLGGQLERLMTDLPEARWHQYEPLHCDHVREGARLAFGRDVDTLYRFDRADVIVSLDADFLADMPGSVRHARDFSTRRRAAAGSAPMNRLYVFESSPTITGAAADHRFPIPPQSIETLARAIHSFVVLASDAAEKPPEGGTTNKLGTTNDSGVPAAWIQAMVSDLRSHRGRSIVVAGRGQPASVHALVHAINVALENSGATLAYIEPIAVRPENQIDSLKHLVTDMRAGSIEALIILGCNPVYATPGELDFIRALERVKLRVHLSEYYDETSRLCDWHVPAGHYLEAWGDTRAYDGTVTILQPLIAPLYGGRSAHEIIAILAGESGRSGYELVQDHWRQQLGEEYFARQWRRAVHDGVVAGTASPAVHPQLNPPAAIAARPNRTSVVPELTVQFRAAAALGDGRYANNGWLQELPHPLTKITWDNVALLSPATAEGYGFASGDVIDIARGDRRIEAPAWIMPGQPDGCVTLTLGYGRLHAGRVGTNVGYDAYRLLPGDGTWFTAGIARLAGRKHSLATVQDHHSMEGRDIVRVTTIDRIRADQVHTDAEHHGPLPTLYPKYDYEKQPNAWGMVIDQTACIGCNACVVACQAENNIPIVGKEQVQVGREMHWLRIDRYYHGELENPETYFQPMMCVHCENAPCEVVCPVAATVHDAEGTSNMIYNRCVGTRYCSNNCPYKVRRFNFLQYSDETTPSIKLMHNPDVTVRSRGVMEKCSYCIQRINVARIAAKREERTIADGEVVTACQQACPTRAIVFGNLNDSRSEVNRLKQLPLNYGVLAELNTRPRTTYLPRVTNPHPDLEDPSAAKEHL